MSVSKIQSFKSIFWPPVENDDYLSAASYRALMIFSIVGFLISCVITRRYLGSESPDIALFTELVLFSFPVFLLFPILLYRKVSIKTVGRAFSIYAVFRLAILAVSFGGIDSTQSLFLIPVVLISTFVLGGKEGFVGLFATFLVYLGLFLAQKNNITSTAELADLKQHFIQLLAVLGMVVGAGATFRHQLVNAVEDLVEAKANSEASNMAKSEFLANMSHEIRTPMNGVLGMADVLKASQLTPKQGMLVQTIDRSGNALLKIINDILDFSKIEAGKMEFEAQPVIIREIIEDVSALLQTAAAEKGLELRTRCSKDVPGIVTGDNGRIRQVLVNLVGNAIKFTTEGYVLIDVTCDGDDQTTKLKVTVTDTGIGIPAEKVGAVFDKFSQADGSMTRRYGGTGLGLAISKSLVVAMNGDIGLTSELGKGSNFFFTLDVPVVQKEAKLNTRSLHNETKVPVLVVSASEDNRSRLIKNLTAWGVQTICADTGQKALRALDKVAQTKLKFPMIVLENRLPDMHCSKVLDQIKSMRPVNSSPVIFVRSEGMRDNGDLHLIAQVEHSLKSTYTTEELKKATYDLLLRSEFGVAETSNPVENDTQKSTGLQSNAA